MGKVTDCRERKRVLLPMQSAVSLQEVRCSCNGHLQSARAYLGTPTNPHAPLRQPVTSPTGGTTASTATQMPLFQTRRAGPLCHGLSSNPPPLTLLPPLTLSPCLTLLPPFIPPLPLTPPHLPNGCRHQPGRGGGGRSAHWHPHQPAVQWERDRGASRGGRDGEVNEGRIRR